MFQNRFYQNFFDCVKHQEARKKSEYACNVLSGHSKI